MWMNNNVERLELIIITVNNNNNNNYNTYNTTIMKDIKLFWSKYQGITSE